MLDVVRHAVALTDGRTYSASETVLVAQLRSIALDLQQATGPSRADGLAAMRAAP